MSSHMKHILRVYSYIASVLVALALTQSSDEIQQQFHKYQDDFGKNYDSAEQEAVHFEAFASSYLFIKAENAKGNSFTLGLNMFSDMSRDYFRKTHFGVAKNSSGISLSSAPFLGMHESPTEFVAPVSVDWRKEGAVTRVKDQGDCGSCWSFSATGALEGAWKIASGDLIPMSEQQFVDCDFATGGMFGNSNYGCFGGEPYWAFDYAQGAAICRESSYPYTAEDPGTKENVEKLCKAHAACSVAIPQHAIKGYKLVTRFSESALMSAVAQQPVSIGIDADADVFHHYKSGIITASCGILIDHAVLLVGYGADSGNDYWTVKNSWGTTWGEAGYVRLVRGKIGLGECSIKSSPHYPVVETTGLATLVV